MSTLGSQFMINKVYEDDAVAIKLIKEAGAIILVRGNTPQVNYLPISFITLLFSYPPTINLILITVNFRLLVQFTQITDSGV